MAPIQGRQMHRFKYSGIALATSGVFVLIGAAIAALGACRVWNLGVCSDLAFGWAVPLASGVALGVFALLLIDGGRTDESGRAVLDESPCPACGRPIGAEWRICPHCGEVRTCDVQLTGGGP
ncbi:MAG: zinc ribbon domain-containing protein [Coriobacteriia bacterium]|nr:zinc ribbon domain-containing protein [Coriobacteriia bacterium]